MASVLVSLDPSFLNNLQANQIDDLDAVLSHLQDESVSKGKDDLSAKNRGESATIVTASSDVESGVPNNNNHNTSTDDPAPGPSSTSPRPTSTAPAKGGIRPATEEELSQCNPSFNNQPETSSNFSRLLPNGNQDLRVDPVVLGPQFTANEPLSSPRECPLVIAEDENRSQSQMSDYRFSDELEEEEPLVSPDITTAQDAGAATNDDGAEESTEEIQVNLDDIGEGSSLRFPGSSKSVTISADVLEEMRKSMKESFAEKEMDCSTTIRDDSEDEDKEPDEPSDSPPSKKSKKSERPLLRSTKLLDRKKKKRKRRDIKKTTFGCNHCSKVFPTQKLLEKHEPFHVEINRTCDICGKLFYKKWSLDEHMAEEHAKGKSLSCQECGQLFQWERNLLAHIQLHHQPEVRHRCKHCPLTFLKRKSYINHHKSKHPEKQPTWCKVG